MKTKNGMSSNAWVILVVAVIPNHLLLLSAAHAASNLSPYVSAVVMDVVRHLLAILSRPQR